jgi:hypothetical protein
VTARVVIGERCHYCSKWRAPREIQELGTGGAKICMHCLEWHFKAIRILAGNPPDGCQKCGLKFQDLKECDALGNLRMYLVVKDGIYQVLCEPCNAIYERKRADLFRETEYGKRKGI